MSNRYVHLTYPTSVASLSVTPAKGTQSGLTSAPSAPTGQAFYGS